MENEIPGGYHGKILRIDLTHNQIATQQLDGGIFRQYLGGAGFVTHFLWKELSPGIDPLSPDNKLVFANGPVTGLSLAGSARNCIGAKSPLTGGLAKSEAGGFWGAEFRRAGYDVIIIEGRAEKPVYLWIHDGEVSIRDASGIWGLKTKETQDKIRAELGDPKIRAAMIGPAGENLVRYACIMNGLFDAAGRGGLGAVMGSKNLKAVAVRGGPKGPAIADPQYVSQLRRWLLDNWSKFKVLDIMREVGTGSLIVGFESVSNLPVHNFRDGSFPGVANINPRQLKDTIGVKNDGCYACPVRCKKAFGQAPFAFDADYGGPEYETLASLGSNCGVANYQTIAKANELCNAYSMDTISVGASIAWAMECFEKGIISLQDTDGIELRFGNEPAMLEMIELIARRRGIGDLLAEGTARAAQRIGKDTLELTVQVKGLEAGMHEPRVKPGQGIGFMVNPHGADHVCNMHDTAYVLPGQMAAFRPLGIIDPLPQDYIGPRKVALFRLVQSRAILKDSLVLCDILPYSPDQMARLVAAITGWDTGVMEQLKIGERILTTARMFNIREGLTAADDVLPARFFQPKTDKDGVGPLDKAKMDQARSYYYTLMGWDAHTGVPLPEKIEELGID